MSTVDGEEADWKCRSASEWFEHLHEEILDLARHSLSLESELTEFDLVSEAFVRLNRRGQEWKDRKHLFASVRTAMKSVVVDRIRSKKLLQRTDLDLDSVLGVKDEGVSADHLLSQAVERFAKSHPILAQVARHRILGNQTNRSCAQLLDISESTARRYLKRARELIRLSLDGSFQLSIDPSEARQHLNANQRDVFDLWVLRRSLAETSKKLGMTVAAVSGHRKRIRRILGETAPGSLALIPG